MNNILRTYDKIMSISGISINVDWEHLPERESVPLWAYPIVAVALLPALVYVFVSGEDEKNRRELQGDFDKKYQEVERKMLDWIDKVEQNLINLRNKMHGS